MIKFKQKIVILLTISIFLTQSACQALKPKKVSAKDFPPDPRARVEKNINEGKGFRFMGNPKKGTSYEFASSNPLWRAALDTLDKAISLVSTRRGEFGAFSNRLSSTIANLDNVAVNLESARGRIQDTDFAQETSNLAKSQIMQQAATAMLAQANASKQTVLALIQ